MVPVEGKEDGDFGGAQTVDFSKGGLGFISSKKVPLHKEIAIELDLSREEDPAVVIGKVLWVNRLGTSGNFRVGVCFEQMLKGSRPRLDEYFRSKKDV